MRHLAAALPLLLLISACGLLFVRPMRLSEFKKAKKACGLSGATFLDGNIITGKPAIIKAPTGIQAGAWDNEISCVARLFGGDGVSKSTTVSFEMRFFR